MTGRFPCWSERIKRIHERVCKVKSNEEIGVKYMQAWEERYYDKQEAQAEGRAEGARIKMEELIRKKLKKGKSVEEIADDLEESVETIQELIEEISASDK